MYQSVKRSDVAGIAGMARRSGAISSVMQCHRGVIERGVANSARSMWRIKRGSNINAMKLVACGAA